MGYEQYYFYTNQRLLKEYLRNYKLDPMIDNDAQIPLLSETPDHRLIFWKYLISKNLLEKYCKFEANDNPVVIKILIPQTLIHPVLSETFQEKDAYSEWNENSVIQIAESIPFFNVSEIVGMGKDIQFLQGDTTVIEPKHLIGSELYQPLNPVCDELIEAVVAGYSCINGMSGEDIEEEEDEKTIYADEIGARVESQDDDSRKADNLLAAYLMFAQSEELFSGNLTYRIYALLNNSDRSFGDYVFKTFYPKVECSIVEQYTKNLSQEEREYVSALKTYVNGGEKLNIFSAAIQAMLENVNQTQDEFLKQFLNFLPENAPKGTISLYFEDQRARNRIRLLRAEMPQFLPIYFIYIFYDDSFDRICNNLAEFDLLQSGFAAVILSLWGLKAGLKNIYKEYKNINLLYAFQMQMIGENESNVNVNFSEFSRFALSEKYSENAVVFQNLYVVYRNYFIEYHYCEDETDKEILQKAAELYESVNKSFTFRYAFLRQALNTKLYEKAEPNINIILKNKDVIHKKYLQKIKDDIPPKGKKRKKNVKKQTEPKMAEKQQSLFDNEYIKEK